jgi:hypothetical protein
MGKILPRREHGISLKVLMNKMIAGSRGTPTMM